MENKSSIFRMIDVLGAVLLLMACVLLSFGDKALAATLEEQGVSAPAVNYRSKGKPLQMPSQAGKAATVANFLSRAGWAKESVNSLTVKSEMSTRKAGKVVLLGQEVDGLTVYGSRLKAVFDDNGNLLSLRGSMVAATGSVLMPQITPRNALDVAMKAVHPGVNVNLAKIDRVDNTTIFGSDSFFYTDPKVTSVAVPTSGASLTEGFLVEVWSEEANQLYHVLVNGKGKVLEVQNRTADSHDSYHVFLENPGSDVDQGTQTTVHGPEAVSNPDEPGDVSSPDGWIDTGTEQYDIHIQGNNTNAYLDHDNNNGPDSGGNIVSGEPFVFGAAAELDYDPHNRSNPAVAVQNLFYFNNLIHDVLYEHGFTEEWGNFQEDNFGRGGSGSDSVNAEAQDGGGLNNANFATPSDGSNPRMQMYLWDRTSTRRDGSLDGDIVWHEYGHGLTWRIIGNMTGPMGGALGEGWSDTLATIRYNDDAVGEYSFANSVGIRSDRYGSFDPTVKNYESITGNSVHDDGEILGAITWDMWTHYRDDASGSIVGDIDARRNIIMDDFIDGMKLTTYQCSRPTFPTVRDGILEGISGNSDSLAAPGEAFDLARWCHTWNAFAKFGVGVDQSTTCRKRGTRITWEWSAGYAIPDACASSGTGSGVGPITDTDDSANEVAENESSGTWVGITALASDPDGDGVTYSLTDDAGGRFAIDATSGVITVKAALDAETATSHRVTVEATSTDGSTSSEDFTIEVIDDNTEFNVGEVSDSDSSANEVYENAPSGAPVGITAWAVDLDVTDSVTYSLVDDAEGLFAIDATSGQISVNAPLSIGTEYVTARATSTDDGPPSDAVFSIEVLPAPEQSVTLSGSSSSQGRIWTAHMTVSVSSAYPEGSEVIGSANEGSCSSVCSCVISDGVCTLESTSIRKNIGSTEFRLLSVDSVPYTGDPLTILKP